MKTESATPACGQPAVPRRLDDVLKHHELIKLKFDFKDQKKELAPQLAEKSGCHLVTRVGNVVLGDRDKARNAADDAKRALGDRPDDIKRIDDLVKGLGLEG